MRIDDTQKFLVNDTALSSSKKSAEVKRANLSSATSTLNSSSEAMKDKLVISSSSITIAKLKQSLADLPDTRQEKIALLKTRIANGTYNPTGEEIAKKIVDDAYYNKI